jgi:hypothetical protein
LTTLSAQIERQFPVKTETLVMLGVAAAVVGLVIYEKEKPAVASTAAVSTTPTTASVTLQPGETTVAVAPGGSVTLILPAGASWGAANPVSPVSTNTVQPTGTQTFTLVMSTTVGTTATTANWLDSTGTAQSTAINIAVG